VKTNTKWLYFCAGMAVGSTYGSFMTAYLLGRFE